MAFNIIRILFLCLLANVSFPQVQTSTSITNKSHENRIFDLLKVTKSGTLTSSEILDSIVVEYVADGKSYKDVSFKHKVVYYYNNNYSLKNFIISSFSNGIWELGDKHSNTYNLQGKLQTILWESYNPVSNIWQITERDTFSYDLLGNMTNILHQGYNIQFINIINTEYFYDSLNNNTMSLSQFWVDNNWVNSTRIINKYNNKLIDSSFIQVWENSQWTNYGLQIYKYDANFTIDNLEIMKWFDNSWVEHGKNAYKYDARNNCVEIITAIKNNGNWENVIRISYDYDISGNLVQLFNEEWINNQWEPQNGILRITNPDNTSMAFLANKISFYHSEPLYVLKETDPIKDFSLNNYPNPFNPSTKIEFSIPEETDISLSIYNLLGEKITELVNDKLKAGKHNYVWNAERNASGIYIYQLRTKNSLLTKKMLLMK